MRGVGGWGVGGGDGAREREVSPALFQNLKKVA